MSLHQVIYTSCMRGIKGVNDGQQIFSYDSTFTDPDNDEIKSLFSYKPPELPTGVRMSEEIATTLPKSYIYRRLSDGKCTLSLSTYLGRDYMGSAGRFGNHLSHVIVCDESDISCYPCEYFGSSSLRDHMEFEEVNNPEPPAFLPTPVLEKGYNIDIDSVIDFLNIENRIDIYKNMLYAMLSFSRERKRVVICDKPENIIMWIAALEYALPLKTALTINFTTYEYDPSLSASQICGVVAEGSRYTDESRRLHYVFDLLKNQCEEFSKDADFYDFIDTGFSLSFDAIHDFHDFLTNGYNYVNADDELYAAYALYSILSDGIKGIDNQKLNTALSFAEKYASENEKKRIAKILFAQYNELLNVNLSVFENAYSYILLTNNKSLEISSNELKKLAVDKILFEFSNPSMQEQSFNAFFGTVDSICKRYEINLSKEIMLDDNRKRLFAIIQNDTTAWRIAFIIRMISRYAKAHKLPIEELSTERPFGNIYYQLVQKVVNADSSNTTFLVNCILDEFDDQCDYLTNMALNVEGMILDTPNDKLIVSKLWEYYGKKMLEKQKENFDTAYFILRTYDCDDQIFMLYKLQVNNADNAQDCREIFDKHYVNEICKSSKYASKYLDGVLECYYERLNEFEDSITHPFKKELFSLIAENDLEPTFVDELIAYLTKNIPLSTLSKSDERFIKTAFNYTYNFRHREIDGKMLILLIGMLVEAISVKEQTEKKIEQLEIITKHNPADLSKLSENSLQNYYSWILPYVFKWFKSIDYLNSFYDLFVMSTESKQLFILDLANIYLKNAKENKENSDFVRYFQFVSENSTLSIRKELGKILSRLSKSKLAELDTDIRDCYISNNTIIEHWKDVKEAAESTNPILNNIANLFRRKKKGD